jgi:hypothetical protein
MLVRVFRFRCQIEYPESTNLLCISMLRYDNRASDLTKEGMRQGIVDSGAFILFLSAGILTRPFCTSIDSSSPEVRLILCDSL